MDRSADTKRVTAVRAMRSYNRINKVDVDYTGVDPTGSTGSIINHHRVVVVL